MTRLQALLLVSVALCGCAHAEEGTGPVDLGAAAAVGRRGKASTVRRSAGVDIVTGGLFSMTAAFQGNFEEEEADLLGEGTRWGRRRKKAAPAPTAEPTSAPSASPTAVQSSMPATAEPTSAPSASPTAVQSSMPATSESTVSQDVVAIEDAAASDDPIKDEWFNYNAWAMTKIPRDNTKNLTQESLPVQTEHSMNCKTKFLSPRTICGGSDHCSCTSCTSKKYGFVPLYHKQGTGLCMKYTATSLQKCIERGSEHQGMAPDSKRMLCTRLVAVSNEFHYQKLKGNTAASQRLKTFMENKFLPSKKPLTQKEKDAMMTRSAMMNVPDTYGLATAVCNVHKQTVCETTDTATGDAEADEQSVCKVKKSIICDKICRMTTWMPPFYDDESVCIGCPGPLGALACKTAAMMA